MASVRVAARTSPGGLDEVLDIFQETGHITVQEKDEVATLALGDFDYGQELPSVGLLAVLANISGLRLRAQELQRSLLMRSRQALSADITSPAELDRKIEVLETMARRLGDILTSSGVLQQRLRGAHVEDAIRVPRELHGAVREMLVSAARYCTEHDALIARLASASSLQIQPQLTSPLEDCGGVQAGYHDLCAALQQARRATPR